MGRPEPPDNPSSINEAPITNYDADNADPKPSLGSQIWWKVDIIIAIFGRRWTVSRRMRIITKRNNKMDNKILTKCGQRIMGVAGLCGNRRLGPVQRRTVCSMADVTNWENRHKRPSGTATDIDVQTGLIWNFKEGGRYGWRPEQRVELNVTIKRTDMTLPRALVYIYISCILFYIL